MGVVANVPIALAAGLGINGAVAFGLVLTPGPDPGGRDGRHRPRGPRRHGARAGRPARGDHERRPARRSSGRSASASACSSCSSASSMPGSSSRPPARRPRTRSRSRSSSRPSRPHFLFWFGLLMTVALYARKVPAALLISILVTTVIAIVVGRPAAARRTFVATPDFSTLGAVRPRRTSSPCSARLAARPDDLQLHADRLLRHDGHGDRHQRAGRPRRRGGPVPRTSAGSCSSTRSAAAAGGAAGISSNTSYIESAAGVAEGGRTGLHLGRDRRAVPGRHPAHAARRRSCRTWRPAPVLVFVGFLMVSLIKDIDFSDVEEGFPALLGADPHAADVQHHRRHRCRRSSRMS